MSFHVSSGPTKPEVTLFEVCVKNKSVGGEEEEYGKEEGRSYSCVKVFALMVGAKK